MKRVLLAASSLVFSVALMAQTSTTTTPATPVQQTKAEDAIKMNEETHDFGKIKQGVPVTTYFVIKNVTKKPITVENSWGSCGCTTPEKPVEPIAPGKTAKLKVQYNAAVASPFTKDVYIKLAGYDLPKTIHITGEVVAADKAQDDQKAKDN
jgi:hypothetical protein